MFELGATVGCANGCVVNDGDKFVYLQWDEIDGLELEDWHDDIEPMDGCEPILLGNDGWLLRGEPTIEDIRDFGEFIDSVINAGGDYGLVEAWIDSQGYVDIGDITGFDPDEFVSGYLTGPTLEYVIIEYYGVLVEESVPEPYLSYFDWDRWASDMAADFTYGEDSHGIVYVFTDC